MLSSGSREYQEDIHVSLDNRNLPYLDIVVCRAQLSWCLQGAMDEHYEQRECMTSIRKVISDRREEVLQIQVQDRVDNMTTRYVTYYHHLMTTTYS